jgi:hypothetical protein
MRKYSTISNVFSMVYIAVVMAILAACGDNGATSTLNPVTNPVTQTAVTTVLVSPAPQTSEILPVVTPTKPVTISVATLPESEARRLAREALVNQEQAIGFRFSLKQNVILSSNNSQALISAEGEGEYSRPDLRFRLVLNTGGQSQSGEILLQKGELWQKIETLAVWKKYNKGSALIPASILDRATGVQAQNIELLDGIQSRIIELTFNGPLFLTEPVLFGPDILGVLSLSGVTQGLSSNSGVIKMILWVSTTGGELIQRQTSFSQSGIFTYSVVTRFRDYNAPGITIQTPPDFPRS